MSTDQIVRIVNLNAAAHNILDRLDVGFDDLQRLDIVASALKEFLALVPQESIEVQRAAFLYWASRVVFEFAQKNCPEALDKAYKQLLNEFKEDKHAIEYAFGNQSTSGFKASNGTDQSSDCFNLELLNCEVVCEKKLGEGSFAVTWLVNVRSLNRKEVIRHLYPELEQREIVRDAFFRESKIIAELSHPYIRRIYDAGLDRNGRPYQRLEYVDGVTLQDYLKSSQDQTMSVVNACSLIDRVAEGLAVSHAKRVVHRDLKPSNILLENRSILHPKISDFGLAVPVAERLRERGLCVGTLAYMSPEQIRGKVESLDGRADVWAVGALLYELLTGSHPFKAVTTDLLKQEILHCDPVHVRQLKPEVDDGINKLVNDCLAKNINDRISSMAELRERLSEIQEAKKHQRLSLSVEHREDSTATDELPATFMQNVVSVIGKAAASVWFAFKEVSIAKKYAVFLLAVAAISWGFDIATFDFEKCFPPSNKHWLFSRVSSILAIVMMAVFAIDFVLLKSVLQRVRTNIPVFQRFVVMTAIACLAVSLPGYAYFYKQQHVKSALELRILVLDYKNSGSNATPTIRATLADVLDRIVEENSELKIKVINRSIEIDRRDREKAEELATQYLATIVLWGEYDEFGYFTRIRDLYTAYYEKEFDPLVKSPGDRFLDKVSDFKFGNMLVKSPHDEVGRRVYIALNIVLANHFRSPGFQFECYERALEEIKQQSSKIDSSYLALRIAFLKSGFGDFQGAYSIVSEMIAADDSPSNFLHRADICIINHRFAEARNDIEEARKRGAGKRELLFTRARLAEEFQDWSKAIELYEEYISLPLDSESLKVQVAFAYNNLANVGKATRRNTIVGLEPTIYDKAIETEPRIAMFWHNRAFLKIDLIETLPPDSPRVEDYLRSAISDFEEALKLDPYDLPAEYGLVYAYILSGKQQLALQRIDRLLGFGVSTFECHVLRRMILHHLGRQRESDEARTLAIRAIDPSSISYRFTSNTCGSDFFIRRYAKLFSDDSIYWILLAFMELREERREKVVVGLGQAFTQESDPSAKSHIKKLLDAVYIPLEKEADEALF